MADTTSDDRRHRRPRTRPHRRTSRARRRRRPRLVPRRVRRHRDHPLRRRRRPHRPRRVHHRRRQAHAGRRVPGDRRASARHARRDARWRSTSRWSTSTTPTSWPSSGGRRRARAPPADQIHGNRNAVVARPVRPPLDADPAHRADSSRPSEPTPTRRVRRRHASPVTGAAPVELGYITMPTGRPRAGRRAFFGALFGWQVEPGNGRRRRPHRQHPVADGLHATDDGEPAGPSRSTSGSTTSSPTPARSRSSAARCSPAPTTTPAATPSASTTRASASTSSTPPPATDQATRTLELVEAAQGQAVPPAGSSSTSSIVPNRSRRPRKATGALHAGQRRPQAVVDAPAEAEGDVVDPAEVEASGRRSGRDPGWRRREGRPRRRPPRGAPPATSAGSRAVRVFSWTGLSQRSSSSTASGRGRGRPASAPARRGDAGGRGGRCRSGSWWSRIRRRKEDDRADAPRRR